MKSRGLKELVRRIFSDEKIRHQFESNPDSVINQFALTEQERKAVLSTHGRMGLVTGDSQELEAAFADKWDWNAPVP